MFITKKKHLAIVQSAKEKVARDMDGQIETYKRRIRDLQDELAQARELKFILEKLGTIGASCLTLNSIGGATLTSISGITFPDDVAHYVTDYFGGKVIKQEATKVIEIAADGSIKTGLTKQAPDDGFTYILRRECKPTT